MIFFFAVFLTACGGPHEYIKRKSRELKEDKTIRNQSREDKFLREFSSFYCSFSEDPDGNIIHNKRHMFIKKRTSVPPFLSL